MLLFVLHLRLILALHVLLTQIALVSHLQLPQPLIVKEELVDHAKQAITLAAQISPWPGVHHLLYILAPLVLLIQIAHASLQLLTVKVVSVFYAKQTITADAQP